MAEYFDVLTSIVNKKEIKEEDILKHFNGWHTMTWLAYHPRAVWEANKVNSARGNKFIGKLQEYKALKGLINIPKKTYIKADKTDKHAKVILDVIMRHFSVGKTTSIDYFKILPGENIIKLLELYARKNENQISTKDLSEVKKIRDAITAKKKEIMKKG